MTPSILTAALWIAFVSYWVIASRHAKRTIVVGQPALIRAVAVVFMAFGPALYYLPLTSVPFLGWRLLPRHPVLAALGLGLMIFGLMFAIWGRRALADNWSGTVTLKEDHALVTSGPYRIVRHPIYLGVFAAMLGTAVVIGEVRAFLPLLGMFGVWKKMAAEEALLRSAFPRQYEEYARHIKRLIPGIL